MIRREIERQQAVADGVVGGVALQGAFDEGRPGWEMLFQHQELALPLGKVAGDVAVRVDLNTSAAADGHLRRAVLERSRVDRHAESGGKRLPFEFGVGRQINPPRDQRGPIGLILIRAEVASEARERD